MIQETNPKFESIKNYDEKENTGKFDYFSQDISWLWRLQEIIEEIKESER